MAHFAELDENNTVLGVLVVHNDVITLDGVEDEQRGIDFLNDLIPDSGTWVQTSYNGNLRSRFAGIGYTYDEARDAFISVQPFPSWVLDDATTEWVSPVPMIDGYLWDEDTTSWVQPPQPYPSWTWEDDHWQWPGDPPDDQTGETDYDWDEDTTSWVEVTE
jgi:hypothetical protein